MSPRWAFEELIDADLVLEAVYEGGPQPTVAADPLAQLLPCGNQGGFRYHGTIAPLGLRLAVLYTSRDDPDWPDNLDEETGLFTYFGDNKTPGSALHDTPRGGNRILRACFEALHAEPPQRRLIPPFLVFFKERVGPGRDVVFRGLAVPGGRDLAPGSDLVALWRTTGGQRFQNYRAVFTVLDVGSVARSWIAELAAGQTLGPSCPGPFRLWAEQGTYTPLESPRTQEWRAPGEQRPGSPADEALVATIYDYFSGNPHAFEGCAVELWKMMAKESVTFVEGTRPSVDGGRDAIGRYSVGPAADRIHLEFSLEAKCYAPATGAGVADTARLISRLRHREFGVFVTTSYVSPQAYRELREDRHPVVVICGKDIAGLLKQHGVGTPTAATAWLEANFPLATTGSSPASATA